MAISWISTSETISQAGARPVFVDVDEHGLMDVDAIEAAITPRTRAVIPVHLYGQAVNMSQVVEICRRHGVAAAAFLAGIAELPALADDGIVRIDGEQALGSTAPFARALIEAGFHVVPQGLRLRR